MTVRVYLQAGRFHDGAAEPGDLAAERIFVDVADVPELWVETESAFVPPTGRVVSFSIASGQDLGFRRVTGTVERRVNKHTKERLGEDESPHPQV